MLIYPIVSYDTSCGHCDTPLVAEHSIQICAHCHRWNFLGVKEPLLWIDLAFALYAKLALADGIITPDEIARLQEEITNLAFTPEETTRALESFQEALHSDMSVSLYDNLTVSLFDMEVRESLYFSLWLLAASDGILDPSEEKMLKILPNAMAISDYLYDVYHDYFIQNLSMSSLDPYYQILESPSYVSDEELTYAYYKKRNTLLPDALMERGLSEGFVQFITTQAQMVEEAFAILRKSRGF